MKGKTILVGLGLVMFIFCSVNFSQAALSPDYYKRFLAPSTEHPWQDSDAPPPATDITYPYLVRSVQGVLTPFGVIIIKSYQVRPAPDRTQVVRERPSGRTRR